MGHRWSRLLVFLLAAVILSAAGIGQVKEAGRFGRLQEDTVKTGAFRRQTLDDGMQGMIRDMEDPGELLGIYWLETGFGEQPFSGNCTEQAFESMGRSWKRRPYWNVYAEACRAIWDDLVYFPIPVSKDGEAEEISFVDSWMYERNYGGTRGHEGTDIMAGENVRGYYPVVSMTDGYVTHKGWLEQGGYRLGITAPGGAYFYYAHLDSYAEIEEGDPVKAGDLLGFMGDTGYSKKEGTMGMFPVHLHVGIYLIHDGEEISVNPYQPLKYLENRRIECVYGRKN
ncbi:M23 family metallopeptidase [Mediterraneibacter glycyrrhizinilyticus]